MKKNRKVVKLAAEADLVEVQDWGTFNKNLYKDGTIDSKEFNFKEEIIDYLFDSFDWNVNTAHYSDSEEKAVEEFEAVLTCPVSELTSKFGTFTEDDLYMLEQDLADNPYCKEKFKEDIRHIDNRLDGKYINIEPKVTKDTIEVTLTAEEY